MRTKRLNQTLIGSFLLLSIDLPVYAARDVENYPVVISFSSKDDAKQMVQSTYSTLTDLNRALITLNKYISHSLDTGHFFEDQTFQDKKNKIIHILNKQKLRLHIFGKQEININFYNSKNNKHYKIRIPALDPSELGLDNTQITSVNNAKETLHAISAADQKLLYLLTPKEVSASNFDEKQAGLNILKIKHPESFIAITHSLEQVLKFYRTNLSEMSEYAHKSASGKYSKQEMQYLNTEYVYRVSEMSRNIIYSNQTINSLEIFKDNELILNLDNQIQKKYYMPELSLSTLQLDKDSIYDFDSCLKSYDDIDVVRNWVLDWNITGQQGFNPASDSDRTALAPHFLVKK